MLPIQLSCKIKVDGQLNATKYSILYYSLNQLRPCDILRLRRHIEVLCTAIELPLEDSIHAKTEHIDMARKCINFVISSDDSAEDKREWICVDCSGNQQTNGTT